MPITQEYKEKLIERLHSYADDQKFQRLGKYLQKNPYATEHELRESGFGRFLAISDNHHEILREYFSIPPIQKKPKIKVNQKCPKRSKIKQLIRVSQNYHKIKTRELNEQERQIEASLIEIIASKHGVDKYTINPEKTMAELKLDQLNIYELEFDFEDLWNININYQDESGFDSPQTIRGYTFYISDKLAHRQARSCDKYQLEDGGLQLSPNCDEH